MGLFGLSYMSMDGPGLGGENSVVPQLTAACVKKMREQQKGWVVMQ